MAGAEGVFVCHVIFVPGVTTPFSPSDPEALDAASPSDTLGPAARLNLCGIDHEALNKQILEYKRRRAQGHGSTGPLWPEHVADLTKQMRRRKAKTHVDDDLSPKNYLHGGE